MSPFVPDNNAARHAAATPLQTSKPHAYTSKAGQKEQINHHNHAPASATTIAKPAIVHPLAAAKPKRTLFDPWNSSATGHQRAENRLGGSTAWRASRSLKLGEQFAAADVVGEAGNGGGRRMADTVGAGSEAFGCDGRLANGGWERGAPGLRSAGQLSLAESFTAGAGRHGLKVRKEGVERREDVGKEKAASQEGYEAALLADLHDETTAMPTDAQDSEESVQQDLQRNIQSGACQNNESTHPPQQKAPQLFANLTVYINGSTAPLISDHKLKQLLVTHGARLSIALGRRTVTHVVLGHPVGLAGAGAGGGLAGSKIQKEIARVGGKGVKFVSAEWIVESVRAGKRLPESRFEALKLAPRGVKSVAGMFGQGKGGSREGG